MSEALVISRQSWLAQRRRWKMSWRGNLWRGHPDGCGALVVFKDKLGQGWRWCIALDGEEPVFSPVAYRTRAEARAAVEAEAA
jgi:hypothetical protein